MEANWSKIKSKPSWDQFISRQPRTDFRSSWNWGLAQQGSYFRRGLVIKDQLQAVYTATLVKLPQANYLNLVGNPLLAQPQSSYLWRALKSDLKQLALAHRVAFIRLSPPILTSPTSRKLLTADGWRPTSRSAVNRVASLDLKPDLASIEAGFKAELKNHLTISQQPQFKFSAQRNLAACQQFYQLLAQPDPATKTKLFKLFTSFQNDDQVIIYQGLVKGQLKRLHWVIFAGTEASLYRAASNESSSDQLTLAAKLHQLALREAHRRGLTSYNLGPVVGIDQINHPLLAISQLKRDFGALDQHYLASHDLVLKPSRYLMIQTLAKTRFKTNQKGKML